MERKTYRQREWFVLGTLLCMGSSRFGGKIHDYATEARFCLMAAGESEEIRHEQMKRHLELAGELLMRLASETELTMLEAGYEIWSEEDSSYLKLSKLHPASLELGLDVMAEFGSHLAKERERFGKWLSSKDEAVALNSLLVLTERTARLVRQEQKRLVEEMEEAKRRGMNPEAVESPKCPICGAAMRLRTAKNGANAGQQFWGCTQYPSCRGIRDVIVSE
ncbi:MAG: topoisomerase DNA-binding C4 zinc finger domain-containing protein [Victivallales bacterium]|nr:topoisomerase DNA-binding C4 zinc finger domain-containing protein [Victivallales bacterium]